MATATDAVTEARPLRLSRSSWYIADGSEHRRRGLIRAIRACNADAARAEHAPRIKSRSLGDILIQNQERPYFDQIGSCQRCPTTPASKFTASRNPGAARIGYLKLPGKGVHRMWFTDGKYAHCRSDAAGNQRARLFDRGHFSPCDPKEAGRWWIPGTKEGEETPPDWTPFPGEHFHVHGAIPHGERSYVALVDAGMVIIDISDINNPRRSAGSTGARRLAATPTRLCRCRAGNS